MGKRFVAVAASNNCSACNSQIRFTTSVVGILGTLRYEDGKARTATAVDAGNSQESRRVAKNKIFKMCIFVQDGDVNNWSFIKALYNKTNDILSRR